MTVVVFGSANLDSVIVVDEHPVPGETVRALGPVRTQAGGKGLNQAVACRVATAHRTVFIGAVGDDPAGDLVLSALERAGVEPELRRSTHSSTGSAVVVLDRHAENAIVVVPAANEDLNDVTEREAAIIAQASIVAFQGETPASGFESAASVARRAGATVLLNAAPVWPLSDGQAGLVDLLVVNETESRDIARYLNLSSTGSTPEEVCRSLARRFPAVVVTLGAAGALWSAGDAPVRVPAPSVIPVDTTGAGDTFCGVLCGGLAEGLDLPHAIALGIRAASLAVTRPGTGDAVPQADELRPPISPNPNHP